MRKSLITIIFGSILAFVPAISCAAITNVTVQNNTLEASVDLGAVSAELTVAFEQVVGLSVENLGLSATLVSPTDVALLSRLGNTNVSLASGFPLLISIAPPANGGLAFEGVVDVELYTHDLQYTAGSPLRLFSASSGGTFHDITASMSSGSYRVRGSKGTFSEFLIVADIRTLPVVINDKFTRLANLLDAHALQIDTTTFNNLESLLASAQAYWNNGDSVAAIADVEGFAQAVQSATVPDVWRSARDIENVAGELRAASSTLRFSLTLASNNL